MRFQKGHPKPEGSGRKKGSANKPKVPSVSEFLMENGVNPIKEIIDILKNERELLSPKSRADVYLELLSYCQPKPKGNEEDSRLEDDFEEFEGLSREEILQLVKPPGES